MTWEITDYEPTPGQTSLLMREKRPEEMTQRELLDYVYQLESVVDYKNQLIESYKVALGLL